MYAFKVGCVVKPLSRCINNIYLDSTEVNLEHTVARKIPTYFQNVHISIRPSITKPEAYDKFEKNNNFSVFFIFASKVEYSSAK